MSNWDDAWAEMKRRWLPDDPVQPTDEMSAYYRVKWETVAGMPEPPKLIAEIGVRAGYSALAMLLAAPGASYVGFEQDAGQFGGQRGITGRAVPTVLAGFDWDIEWDDSQEIHSITMDVDFFHVDGDHSWDGAMHDIQLAWDCSRYVLVDDYDYIRSVQAACDHFIVTHRLAFPLCQALGDGGYRGNMFMVGRREIERRRKA